MRFSADLWLAIVGPSSGQRRPQEKRGRLIVPSRPGVKTSLDAVAAAGVGQSPGIGKLGVMFYVCSMPIKPPELDELPDQPRKGRGAVSNRTGRFEAATRHRVDDGWGLPEPEQGDEPPLRTQLHVDTARTII